MSTALIATTDAVVPVNEKRWIAIGGQIETIEQSPEEFFAIVQVPGNTLSAMNK